MTWEKENPQGGGWEKDPRNSLADGVPETLRYSQLTAETYENQDWVYNVPYWGAEGAESGDWDKDTPVGGGWTKKTPGGGTWV
jgi:hypothetical protein